MRQLLLTPLYKEMALCTCSYSTCSIIKNWLCRYISVSVSHTFTCWGIITPCSIILASSGLDSIQLKSISTLLRTICEPHAFATLCMQPERNAMQNNCVYYPKITNHVTSHTPCQTTFEVLATSMFAVAKNESCT